MKSDEQDKFRENFNRENSRAPWKVGSIKQIPLILTLDGQKRPDPWKPWLVNRWKPGSKEYIENISVQKWRYQSITEEMVNSHFIFCIFNKHGVSGKVSLHNGDFSANSWDQFQFSRLKISSWDTNSYSDNVILYNVNWNWFKLLH